MQTVDPLVSIEASEDESKEAASLAGWIVAAEIIARLREHSLLSPIDVAAIIGPALADLTRAELDELSRQLDGPLFDSPRSCLERYLRRQH
jgi:hypothetical protein